MEHSFNAELTAGLDTKKTALALLLAFRSKVVQPGKG